MIVVPGTPAAVQEALEVRGALPTLERLELAQEELDTSEATWARMDIRERRDRARMLYQYIHGLRRAREAADALEALGLPPQVGGLQE